CLDRGHLGGDRAKQAERARQPIGLGETSLGVAVRLGADFRGKVFRAPSEPDQPLARAAEGAGDENPGCRLDRLGDDLNVAASARAAVLRSGAIESSRSTITASAPLENALSSLLPPSAGTKRSERMAPAHWSWAFVGWAC